MSGRGWIAGALVAALAAGGGWWAGARTGMPDASSAGDATSGPCPGGAEPLHWKAPMDPSYVRDEPGQSPMGMDLVPVCPDEGGAEGPGIRISSAVLQQIGVKTAEAERRRLTREVRAVGRVTYDERLVSHVHTKVQGWVERLHVEYEGEEVRRGEPLVEIYSPELVATQEELLIASRYRDDTARSPFADVVGGGRSLLEATRRRLELWDIPERDVERLLETGEVRKALTLYAPTGGVVTELSVRKGMEVGPNDNLYTIADLSRVWVHADVYEYELPWVEVGQKAVVELSYLPDRTFEGELTYVYPFLDPKTRTARVRVELPNPHGHLKPDMYADVTLETSVRRDALAVPERAVLRSGRRQVVIVAHGEGRFAPRPVRLGLEAGDGWVEVREGLEAGTRVVTSGQFLIDSESRLREAVQTMLEPEAEEGAGSERESGMGPSMEHGTTHEGAPSGHAHPGE